jgi:hypothetical protein
VAPGAAGICVTTLTTNGTTTNAATAAAIAKLEQNRDESNLFMWSSFSTGVAAEAGRDRHA